MLLSRIIESVIAQSPSHRKAGSVNWDSDVSRPSDVPSESDIEMRIKLVIL